MTGEKQEIELRSEDFNEVLNRIPPWILRWGITMVAGIMLLLLVGSALFKYPDTISSTVTLTGTVPVAGVVGKTSGKIQEMYVEDNQQVEAGKLLAVIENPAKTEDVIRLRKIVKSMDTAEMDTIDLVPSRQLQLGGLQSLYSSFYLTMSEYRQFKELAYYLKKIEIVKERIIKNEIYYRNMTRQKDLLKQQTAISHQQYVRDSLLGVKNLLSKEETERSYSQYLQSFLSMETMDRSLENLQIQLGQMRESLYDTEYQYQDKKNTLETQLRSLANQLKAEIESWEMNYALITPVAGKITFSRYWTKNQNVTAGETIFSIVPNERGEIIGKALLPTVRSGKVKVGQRVNIRFSNYPDNEYGVVKGYVKNISMIPSASGKEEGKTYTVDIGLPGGLKTTYNKELPFLPEMEGQADIITDDLSLLERMLLPIKKILTENL